MLLFVCFGCRSELYGAFYEATKAPNQKDKSPQSAGETVKQVKKLYNILETSWLFWRRDPLLPDQELVPEPWGPRCSADTQWCCGSM